MNTNLVRQLPEADASTTLNVVPDLSASVYESHYSVQVLAELWRLDETTIRGIFEDVPGVFRLVNERRRRGKREYVTLRIPASVAEREYQRRVVAAARKKGA